MYGVDSRILTLHSSLSDPSIYSLLPNSARWVLSLFFFVNRFIDNSFLVNPLSSLWSLNLLSWVVSPLLFLVIKLNPSVIHLHWIVIYT